MRSRRLEGTGAPRFISKVMPTPARDTGSGLVLRDALPRSSSQDERMGIEALGRKVLISAAWSGGVRLLYQERDHHLRHRHGGHDRGENAEPHRYGEARAPGRPPGGRGSRRRRTSSRWNRRSSRRPALNPASSDWMIERPGVVLLADALVDQDVGESTAMPIVRTMPAMPGRVRRRAKQHQTREDEGDVHGERDIGEDAEGAVGHRACSRTPAPR